MKNSLGFLLVALSVSLAFSGCMRNDDEPEYPKRPISRLYVSFQDIAQSETEVPVNNVALIDPADTTEMTIDINHNSGALGGAGIYFDPFGGIAFHSGRYDTLIRVMRVNNLGQLANSGKIGNKVLNQMRGLTFHTRSELLYVANIGADTSHIYGFYRPMNSNDFLRPKRDLRLTEGIVPWGVLLWNDSLLVSNSAANGGVLLYSGLSQADSTEIDFPPIATVRIEGASSIRGLAFIDSLDVMVLADFGTQETAGKVYIIEGIKEKLKQQSSTVTPTRTISGTLTGLSGPIDVAIDPRAGRRAIYVADQTTRKISRFKLSDNGNVEPETTITFNSPNRTPFSIFLDVRGLAQ